MGIREHAHRGADEHRLRRRIVPSHGLPGHRFGAACRFRVVGLDVCRPVRAVLLDLPRRADSGGAAHRRDRRAARRDPRQPRECGRCDAVRHRGYAARAGDRSSTHRRRRGGGVREPDAIRGGDLSGAPGDVLRTRHPGGQSRRDGVGRAAGDASRIRDLARHMAWARHAVVAPRSRDRHPRPARTPRRPASGVLTQRVERVRCAGAFALCPSRHAHPRSAGRRAVRVRERRRAALAARPRLHPGGRRMACHRPRMRVRNRCRVLGLARRCRTSAHAGAVHGDLRRAALLDRARRPAGRRGCP